MKMLTLLTKGTRIRRTVSGTSLAKDVRTATGASQITQSGTTVSKRTKAGVSFADKEVITHQGTVKGQEEETKDLV
jgi:hypothetical protein